MTWQVFSDAVNSIGLVATIAWLLYAAGLRRIAIGWTVLLGLAMIVPAVLGVLAAVQVGVAP